MVPGTALWLPCGWLAYGQFDHAQLGMHFQFCLPEQLSGMAELGLFLTAKQRAHALLQSSIDAIVLDEAG